MAFTAIPSGDVWVQIGSTQTPTSGSAVTFSSIPAVKKLRLIISNVTLTASGALDLTLNNDTSALYNISYLWNNGTTTLPVVIVADTKVRTGRGSGTSSHVSDFIIDYTNQASPKLISGFGGNNGTNNSMVLSNNTYNSTAIITRLDITTATTFAAGNTGTIALYGAF